MGGNKIAEHDGKIGARVAVFSMACGINHDILLLKLQDLGISKYATDFMVQ